LAPNNADEISAFDNATGNRAKSSRQQIQRDVDEETRSLAFRQVFDVVANQ
jgi:hypothetical protein